VKPWDWFYEVAVTTTKWGEYKASYPRDATHELEIRIERPAMLTVQIPNAGDHPAKDRARGELYEGADVSWSMSPVPRVNQPSRADGKVEAGVMKYGPMQPGTYTFQIKLGEDDMMYSPRRGAEIAHWTFEITSGDNTQTCPIPPLHRLTMVIDKQPPQPGFMIADSARRVSRQFRVAAGSEQVVVDDITPGTWRIYNDEGEMTVQVNGDINVALNLRPYECVELSSLGAGGRIEALGLRNGDKLISVDGEKFDSIRTLRTQLDGSEAKDSTTWTVLRGGQSVDVTFNGNQLGEIRADRTYPGENYGAQSAYRD
jgi:hypothetical protein